MRTKFAVLLIAVLSPTSAFGESGGFFSGLSEGLSDSASVAPRSPTFNCDAAIAPDVATLIKQIDDYERNLRKIHLPKDQEARLLKQARDALIKNYSTMHMISETCTQKAEIDARRTEILEGRRLRKIQKQNSEIIEGLEEVQKNLKRDELNRRLNQSQ